MFQKPAFLDWNEETHDRYLTLGGFPVYEHKEPSYLARAFRRAQDYVHLPEVKYPMIAFVGALTLDNLNALNYENILSVNVLAAAFGGLVAKYYEGMIHYISDLSPISVPIPRFRKQLYFDKEPEGFLNSTKPQIDSMFTLKARSAFNTVMFGAFSAGMMAMPFVQKDLSLTSLAVVPVFVAPMLTSSFRHAQVALGNWDLTDRPPPPKKKPEMAPASAQTSYSMA